MFCPRCSQQFGNDVRFCSRCGIQLNLIADIVANDGFLQAPPSVAAPVNKSSARQKGMRWGAKLMFAGLALFPPFFGLSFPTDSPVPLLVPATIFFAGLCLHVYSRLFGDGSVPISMPRRSYPVVNAPPNAARLFPERVGVNSFDIRRPNTSEAAQPASVTDHTTQFFDQ